MHYKLKKPCKDCPFRADIPPFLTQARAEEIASSLVRSEFPCHKTLEYDDDEGHETKSTAHCAGALIMLEKMEQPSQMMRISERLGMYDRFSLDMDSPIFDDAESFIDAQVV